VRFELLSQLPNRYESRGERAFYRTPHGRTPRAARRSRDYSSVTVGPRTLRGGPVFPARSTTPSNLKGGSVYGRQNAPSPSLGQARRATVLLIKSSTLSGRKSRTEDHETVSPTGRWDPHSGSFRGCFLREKIVLHFLPKCCKIVFRTIWARYGIS
jgi:hypothetical protein